MSSVNIRTVITLGSESAERTLKGPTDMFDVLKCSSVETSSPWKGLTVPGDK